MRRKVADYQKSRLSEGQYGSIAVLKKSEKHPLSNQPDFDQFYPGSFVPSSHHEFHIRSALNTIYRANNFPEAVAASS